MSVTSAEGVFGTCTQCNVLNSMKFS